MPLHDLNVQVENLPEFVAAIRKVNRDLPKHMSKAFKQIAIHVVKVAQGKMEFGSGPAAKSLKPHGTTTGAYISFPKGGPDASGDRAGMYPWLDFGGGKTGVRGITSTMGSSHKGSGLDRGTGFKRPVIIGGRYLYPATAESRGFIADATDKEMRYLIVAAGFDTEGSWMARELKVKLVADARPFNNTLDAAVGKVTGFKKRIETTGGGSLGKGLAIGAGVASFNLLTSAISAGISQLDAMHEAFLEDEASQSRLAQTLKNTVTNYDAATKAAEEFASAQINLGFEDDAVRDSLGQLVGMTKDLEEAQKLVILSQDLARAKNIDLAQATDVITKAYAGQGRGLTALGINITGAVGRTQLLARAWQNVNGAAEKYATTGAGRVAKANAKMNETMEKVGKAIDAVSQVAIPVMVAGFGALVDAAGELIKWLTDVANFVANTLSPIFQGFASILSGVADLIGGILGAAGDVIGAISGALGGNGGTQTPGVIKIPKAGSINIGVPIHHAGGIVAGSPGSDQLIMAQAGERVIPNGSQGSQVININIASFIGSDRDIDRFTDRIAFRLRATSLS